MAFALLPNVLAICSTNWMTSAYSPFRWSFVMLITSAIIYQYEPVSSLCQGKYWKILKITGLLGRGGLLV